jgi:GntR family transcriptional regulator, sialic acid-inducible nan operon repressor
VAFHYGIATIARNDIFTALLEGLVGWLGGRGLAPAGSAAAAHKGHRQVYEAVAARDPEAAGRAMRDHLEAAGAGRPPV